jgi:hypothetical protein
MRSLSEAAVRQYRELGHCAPVAALTRTEAADLRRHREDFEATGGPMQGAVRHKPHLQFTWLNDLIHYPCTLDAVQDTIGPDILCWDCRSSEHDVVSVTCRQSARRPMREPRQRSGALCTAHGLQVLV